MTDLVHDSALWLNRAQVARDAAAELGELSAALASVAGRYYLGRSCSEGVDLHARLASLIAVLGAELRAEAEAASALGSACETANTAVTQADSLLGNNLGA